jgi:hypothetical protein
MKISACPSIPPKTTLWERIVVATVLHRDDVFQVEGVWLIVFMNTAILTASSSAPANEFSR